MDAFSQKIGTDKGLSFGKIEYGSIVSNTQNTTAVLALKVLGQMINKCKFS